MGLGFSDMQCKKRAMCDLLKKIWAKKFCHKSKMRELRVKNIFQKLFIPKVFKSHGNGTLIPASNNVVQQSTALP